MEPQMNADKRGWIWLKTINVMLLVAAFSVTLYGSGMSSGAFNTKMEYVKQTGINHFESGDPWYAALQKSERRGDRIDLIGGCVLYPLMIINVVIACFQLMLKRYG